MRHQTGGFRCGYHTGDNSAYVNVSKLRLIAQGGDYGIYLYTTYSPTGSQMTFTSGTGENTLYERKSANGEFTQVSANYKVFFTGQTNDPYYALVVDHAHTMGIYSSDAVNHWSTCTGDDYGTCPMGYEEKVTHTLDLNGKKINVSSDYGLYVCEGTKLSITDSSEDKTGTISAMVDDIGLEPVT